MSKLAINKFAKAPVKPSISVPKPVTKVPKLVATVWIDISK